jgi:hypothetical protein
MLLVRNSNAAILEDGDGVGFRGGPKKEQVGSVTSMP